MQAVQAPKLVKFSIFFPPMALTGAFPGIFGRRGTQNACLKAAGRLTLLNGWKGMWADCLDRSGGNFPPAMARQ